jgi:hypothetical protein
MTPKYLTSKTKDDKGEETFNYVVPTNQTYPAVRFLKPKDRKRILITGGAGFLGSHLVDRSVSDDLKERMVDEEGEFVLFWKLIVPMILIQVDVDGS